ncbi:hypothetical protein [Siansivirga zeaxanthinifaciens]|uniref:Uncharacterized protein n=1 Tax=Siansivirga zeaxanthinifaciens CC-SAMT-1 TaxID=1454006 RepID=A0A0C5W7X3_9FLAO|nr:hypothetical protein [Siansivirga zeaxanthinifaciens]AJR02327.1 hypothetical protein AW14_00385 [Siansivirga zeaxanthinifaciens CC-SAMT-1]
MTKHLISLLLFCFCVFVCAQNDSLSIKNGIENPSILSTHHFGIFSGRINQNFKIAPPKKTTLFINSASGNNFHPFVEAYLPKDPEVRERLSKVIWHDRIFNFVDQETTPADYMNIVIDAIIKDYRIGANFPINKNHELSFTLRANHITKGKYPFTIFTGDEAIEWFHSNIAGGEDPYGRRYYGLNQVNFKYTDRNGKVLELNNNDFFVSGIEFNHYYYPTLTINKTKNIFLNFGSHLSMNTTKFNSSIDLGLSVNALKKITFNDTYELDFGMGFSGLRKNLIDFKDNIDLGNNAYLGTFETTFEIAKFTKKRNYNSFGINYHLQTRYNKKEEASYYKLLGKWREINGGWQHGFETLYKNLSYWTFIYTYGRPSFKLSVYFQEDFYVNNAPDVQAGIGIKIPILK